MLEREFKYQIKKELKDRLPGCIILKNDPECIQGIPDIIILWNERWAALETKRTANSPHRPNQDYYVDLMDKMSFAAFIYPENREEVLDDLVNFMKNWNSRRNPCL